MMILINVNWSHSPKTGAGQESIAQPYFRVFKVIFIYQEHYLLGFFGCC